MKLLFDANLSHRLVSAMLDDFPQSSHVRDLGLARASDEEIWRCARDRDFTIVTLDSDFYDLSVLRGPPPRVVWLRSHDTATETILRLLLRQRRRIREFLTEPEAACLELWERG